MGILKDYTNTILKNTHDLNVYILDLKFKEKNKDSIWNYICPYCGEISYATINHIKRGDGCSKCRYTRCAESQKKTQVDFVNELFQIQPNLKVISEYTDYHSKVILSCNIHKNDFYGIPANLLKSKCSCPLCIVERNKVRDTKYTLDFVKEWLYDNDLMMVDESQYKNAGTSFDYKCLICGNIGKTNFGNLLNGRKCRNCMGLSKKTTERFKSEVYELVNNEYSVIGEYKGCEDNILMKHNKCNHEYYVIPTNFLYKNQRCPKCSESKGEKEISKYLKSLNIRYLQEYKFDDCKYKSYLRFDFYLPDLNILIEYQGEQHYKPVCFMGGEKDFELRKLRDEIKRNYCKENNYSLIEISYLDYNKIKEIINEALINVGAFVA